VVKRYAFLIRRWVNGLFNIDSAGFNWFIFLANDYYLWRLFFFRSHDGTNETD